MNIKILMLAGEGRSTVNVYNGLQKDFIISKVIIEEKINKTKLLKKRAKRQGYIKVFGQIIFQLIIPRILKRISKNRLEKIKLKFGIDDSKIPKEKIKNVESVNSKECLEFLKKENPDLIIVNGTRIISKEILNCVNSTFLNTHAGITPKYRGVHGGYWALANQDRENCGVTVHLVDPGIDTGEIIYQENIYPDSKDNFITYTYLQTGIGIKLMKLAISDFLSGGLKSKQSRTKESKLWYHPTIWQYLYLLMTKKVK